MNIEKKIKMQGWMSQPYRAVRERIKRFWQKDVAEVEHFHKPRRHSKSKWWCKMTADHLHRFKLVKTHRYHWDRVVYSEYVCDRCGRREWEFGKIDKRIRQNLTSE